MEAMMIRVGLRSTCQYEFNKEPSRRIAVAIQASGSRLGISTNPISLSPYIIIVCVCA